MADEAGTPKIQIDSDWKAQAQAEKERLAQQEKAKADKGGDASSAGKSGVKGAHGELPPASFQGLVGLLASQAIMGLGAMADPQTGGRIVDLEGARFSIDMLDILEQKTKGNLSKEEGDELRQVLAELRSRFVQISQLVAKQMTAQTTAHAKMTAEPKVSK